MPSALDLPESHWVRLAHKRSSYNRAEIERSGKCGCFYCKEIFGAKEVVDFLAREETALCPRCMIDSVIGDASGFEINGAFLDEMHRWWF